MTTSGGLRLFTTRAAESPLPVGAALFVSSILFVFRAGLSIVFFGAGADEFYVSGPGRGLDRSTARGPAPLLFFGPAAPLSFSASAGADKSWRKQARGGWG